MSKSNLFERKVSLTNGRAPQFQPSAAGQTFFSELNRSLTNTSNEMKAKSENLYINSFLTDSRKAARDIYNKNQGNPEQLAKELSSYEQGLLNEMPQALQPRLQQEYGSLSQKYINKATESKNKELTVQQNIALADNENQILSDIDFAAKDIFSSSAGLTPDEVIARNITSIDSVASSFNSLENNLTQIGADGRPLRNANQTVKALQKAKEYFFAGTANSWLDSQPDKLDAYNKWLNNEVTISLPEGDINVRDAMSPGVRAKVDKQLVQNIKNDIYVENKQAERVEAKQEVFADETKKVMFKLSETGQLTPDQVEASRNILEYKDYKDFRIIAREADPITNGAIYGKLINELGSGKDISERVRIERFTNKTLSNSDYEKLLDKNETKGVGRAVPDPVEAGRDFLLGFLGSNSEALSVTQSATMANAERDYDDRIQDFVDLNKRNPTRQEASTISDEIVERYNVIQVNDFAATLPKPKFMPIGIKARGRNLTVEALDKVKKDTFNSFMEKHGGDMEKVKLDPEFINEVKLIEPFRTIAIKREKK